MGIYAGDAPSLFEVNGQVLTYDEYEFWKFMGKPGPLQFARQLLARKRLQLSQQNTNKQTPRPPFAPEAQHAPRRISEPDYIVYEGEGRRIRVYPDGTQTEETRVSTGPTTRLPTTCRKCGDTLPTGATFCIECGEKV